MSSKQAFKHQDILSFLNEEAGNEEEILEEIKEIHNEEQANKEEFSKNLSSFSNERLCETVVTFRYLGIMQEESILAMQELARRRENGDVYDFEDKITKLYSDLPSINLDLNKIVNFGISDLMKYVGK